MDINIISHCFLRTFTNNFQGWEESFGGLGDIISVYVCCFQVRWVFSANLAVYCCFFFDTSSGQIRLVKRGGRWAGPNLGARVNTHTFNHLGLSTNLITFQSCSSRYLLLKCPFLYSFIDFDYLLNVQLKLETERAITLNHTTTHVD